MYIFQKVNFEHIAQIHALTCDVPKFTSVEQSESFVSLQVRGCFRVNYHVLAGQRWFLVYNRRSEAMNYVSHPKTRRNQEGNCARLQGCGRLHV